VKNLEEIKVNKLKVGVIGAGKMGLLHAGIFNSLEKSTFSAVSEKNGLVVSALKQYLPKANVYSDYEEMLEKEHLDIAVITTPVFLHRIMIERAMDHNLHIFVEKPLSLNSNECQSILRRKNEYKTLVGYCRRFTETYNLAKKIIDSAIIGKINYFQSQLFIGQVFNQGKGWQYDPDKSGGGVLIDLGSHAIDMFHYLFGDIYSVHGIGMPVFSENVEDYVSVNFKFKNDLFGSVQLSWSVKNYRLPELKIYMHFEKGVVTVTEKYVEAYSEVETDLLKKGWNTFYKQDLIRDIPIDIGGAEYTIEDLHLLNCIKEDKETLCNFQEAAKTNFVIDAIYSSINSDDVKKVKYGV
jgi:predicted dehydrogenase